MSHKKTMTLVNGPLKFSAIARGEGPTVLFLHGFPDTLNSWERQLEALADNGYRGIAVAARGYESQSQADNGDYSSSALTSDVIAWIDQLGGAAVHLVGHDWRASIAYGVAMAIPDKIKSLTVIALPHAGRFMAEIHRHPKQLRLSWYMLFFQIPGVADYWVKRKNFAFLRQLWRSWSPDWAFSEQQFCELKEVFGCPGVVESALGYYRAAIGLHSLFQGRASREQLAWPVEVPTLGITGSDEGCIAADVFKAMMREEDFPAGLKLVEVPGAGHFVHREKPDAFNTLLLDWLAAWDCEPVPQPASP